MLKTHIQRQQLVHLHLLINGRCVHAGPYLNQRINLSRKVEKLLGESHICLHNRHGHSGKTVLDDLRLVDGSHKSLVVKTVSSGPSGNLFYLLRIQGTLIYPVKFACFHKHDSAYGQV